MEENFMKLDDIERQELLLHILNKVDFIDGYSKFYNLMYLLKEEFNDELSVYEFDNQFLTIKDNILDNDLNALILQKFVSNDSIKEELAHHHRISIIDVGKKHLKIQKIDKRLTDKLGKKTLKQMDKSLTKYNKLSTNNVMQLVRNKTENLS